MMEKDSKIYVAGHRGMVGSAIVRELNRQGYTNIVTRTHKELDLIRQEQVEAFGVNTHNPSETCSVGSNCKVYACRETFYWCHIS